MCQGTILRDERIVSVADTDVVLAGGNMRRKAMIINAPPTGSITIRFGAAAQAGVGLTLYPGNEPFQLDTGRIGDALKEEVHCIGQPLAQNIYFLDIFMG